MVTTDRLLNSEEFHFNHIHVDVLATGENDTVLAFAGVYGNMALPDQLFSHGVQEMNVTLWNEDSPKRPTGYFVFDQFDSDNETSVSIFVDKRWFFDEMVPQDMQDEYKEEWRNLYLKKPEMIVS